MKTTSSMAIALLLASACADDPPPPVEAEPAPSAAPAQAPAPAEHDLEPTAEQVPIVEDFEEQARSEIKPDNLSAQLDALEQEIAEDSR